MKEAITIVAVIVAGVLVGFDKLDAQTFAALLVGCVLSGPRAIGTAVRDAGEKVGIKVG